MDENNSDATDGYQTGEQQESVADSSQSGYVTADQLQDFQRNLLGDIRKTVAGMLKTQPAQTQSQPSRPAESGQAPQVDVAAIIRQERAMERTMAKHGLNEHQGEIVRQLIESQKPEDSSAFIANFVKQMGIAAPGSSAPQTSAPNPNPASDGGSPGMTPTIESDDQPVWKWSQDRVDKFVREKGYREFVSLMRQRLPKDLHGQRFHFPRS